MRARLRKKLVKIYLFHSIFGNFETGLFSVKYDREWLYAFTAHELRMFAALFKPKSALVSCCTESDTICLCDSDVETAVNDQSQSSLLRHRLPAEVLPPQMLCR